MIPYQDALKKIIEAAEVKKLEAEMVSMEQAIGRVLVDDLTSPEEVPSFDNSAMDGFCVRAADTIKASHSHPCELTVLGLIAAGDPEWRKDPGVGHAPSCVEIMTGAALPNAGYDAVVRIEDVLIIKDAGGATTGIKISRSVQPGENIRLSGTDFRIGQKVLARGTRIEPHHILSLAALGISDLRVVRKSRFAVVSTGSELVSHETKDLPRGMIRNSTGPYLATLLTQMGIEVRSFGIIRDDVIEYRDLLQRLSDEAYDGVISTGAVSMGKFDFVSDVLTELGADIHFHKVAIRPGKPILFAELKTSEKPMAFFGMPGNPVSTAVGCRFFLMPYLQVLSGLSLETPIIAKLALNSKKPRGFRCFFKGRADFSAEGVQVEATKSQASYVVSALTDANCWVVFPEDEEQMKEGTHVEIFPLSNSGGFL